MRRYVAFIIGLLISVHCFGISGSINIDRQTSAAMSAAFLIQRQTEEMSEESVKKILDHYTSAEVATAGIFSSKWLDRKAMENAGLFSNAEENYYYKRIYMMVSTKIMPKILDVATLMIKHPERAIYWGPYLFKVCEQTKQLCMIFETVVTNGKLSFRDIVFLSIGDALRPLFDLARLGSVDWAAVWDHLTEFGSDITREDLEEDLDNLMNTGSAIASAGGAVLDSLWVNSSKVGNIFHSKPREIIDLYHTFRDMYETVSDPMRIKDLVMSQILTTDSTGVANLFKIDNYNIASYISDYIREMEGQYYTQRWTICWGDRGSERLCSYNPPQDVEQVRNSREWYKVGTVDPHYVYTAMDYEESLSNSEAFAGYSRAYCERMNKSEEGRYTYTFKNFIHTQKIYKDFVGTTKILIGYAYAHSIEVYKTWNFYEEVYEELFDSQYNTEAAFQARFDAMLKELNNNEEGKVYYIKKGDKRYYSAADENKLKGCASVSFVMECHENLSFGEGNFSWKEDGDQRHALDEKSKIFAMSTTLSPGPDYSTIDNQIKSTADLVSSYSKEIQMLTRQNDELLAQIGKASIEEASSLRSQYKENLDKINSLEIELDNAQSQLNTLQNLKKEMVDDYADENDTKYRIPLVMHELENAYGISWSDDGRWEGWSFIRHGNMPNIEGELIFKADLSLLRPESHNWLIGRYHRAILGVHWTLTADNGSSSILEHMTLDNSLSESEKAQRVNDRLRELLREHPDCTIEPNYAYSQPLDVPEDEESIHLLWVCDRLEIARDVDYRLSKIYAQLVLVEKHLRTRETLLDYLKRSIGMQVLSRYGRTRLGNKSYKRWRLSATAAAVGTSIADVLAESATYDDEI